MRYTLTKNTIENNEYAEILRLKVNPHTWDGHQSIIAKDAPITAKQWIAALLSENFQQVQGTLYDGTGYCCLGVYGQECCATTDDCDFEYSGSNYIFHHLPTDQHGDCFLPSSFFTPGLTICAYDGTEFMIDEDDYYDYPLQEFFSTINDDYSANFEQIAEIIQFFESDLQNYGPDGTILAA